MSLENLQSCCKNVTAILQYKGNMMVARLSLLHDMTTTFFLSLTEPKQPKLSINNQVTLLVANSLLICSTHSEVFGNPNTSFLSLLHNQSF